MATTPYKKLPGRGRSIMNYVTLWEAEDHFLVVESHVVSETYRRLYYRDIQAVTFCKTANGFIMSIVLGLLTLATGLPAIFASQAVAIVLGIIAAVFLLLTGVNIVRGPTCKCTVRTAVQTQVLPSLGRVATARRVLEILRPRIEAAQQHLIPPPEAQ